jgi:2-methylcitrate dehydratase PrpD
MHTADSGTGQYSEVKVASESFVDFVAVTLAALSTERMPVLLEHVARTSPGTNRLPNGRSASCEKAAFGWGTAAHFLDFDDLSIAQIGHPSAVLYAAILPVAYELDSSGSDVIAAYLAGYRKLLEISGVSAEAQYARGWHTTSSIGVLAAAAAVCQLKGLGPERASDALGIAASFAAGIRANFGSEVKPVHAGWAAGAAIQACQLGELDVTAPAKVLNSTHSYYNVYGGAGWQVPASVPSIEGDLAIKAHAACGFAARPIDAALAVRNGSADLWQDIKKITCSITPLAHDVLQFQNPASGAEAKFSLEYCLAYAMVHGAVPLEAFTGSPMLISANVRHLMNRIERVVDSGVKGGLENEKAELEVLFTSGTTTSFSVRIPKGYPGNRLHETELKAKFRDCVKREWPVERVGELFDRCRNIVDQQSMRAFIDHLTSHREHVGS